MTNLTIKGMYTLDPSIFDLCTFPQELDREVILQGVIQNGQGLTVFYTDPESVKIALGNLTARHLHSWQRMYDALVAEYSPIENFDRYEEYTDAGTGSRQENGSRKTDTYGNAYNSGVDTKTGTIVETPKGEESSDYQSSHKGHLHGNIGVTTNQQMITAELELRKNSIYDIIIEECLNEITLLLY